MRKSVSPIPLTKEAFAPFGDVIELDGARQIAINQGTAVRYHDLAEVDTATRSGKPLISIFRGQPRPQPIELLLMERHNIGSQAFIPMQDRPYLVVVAERQDSVTPDGLRVFRAHGKQGVNYHRGVWHHPLLVLDADSDFLVVDRGGDEPDLEEHWFGDDETILEII